MKQTMSILLVALLLIACGNSDSHKAGELVKEIQATARAGAMPTTAAGYTMKANIDGKEWTATSMMPPDAAGRLIGYYKEEYIGMPYDRRNMQAGKKILIDDNHAADIFIGNDCLWKDPKGEIEITKADDMMAEGNFSFTTTCSSSGKAIRVTDGFFRILFTKK